MVLKTTGSKKDTIIRIPLDFVPKIKKYLLGYNMNKTFNKWRIFMFKIPGTLFLIDDKFDIYDISGNKCSIPRRLSYSGEQIHIDPFGVKGWYDLLWLYVCSIYGIDNKKCFFMTRFEYIPYTRFGYHYFVFHKFPVYYNETHRYVPGFHMLAVDKTGNVINTLTGKVLEGHDSKGYLQLTINGMRDFTHGKKMNITVHRLVATAWIENKNAQIYSMVNHIDGNKRNNHVFNLEWVTPKENVEHAVYTGLDSQAVSCKLRNAETGEILEFPSQQKAVEFLGLKANSASLSVKRQPNYLFNGLYELRNCHDTRPWFYENIEFIPGGTRAQYAFKIIKDDGKVAIINGIDKAFPYIGSRKRGHSYKTNDVIKECNKLHPEWSIELLDFQSKNNTPIEVYNISTGKVTEFKNIQAIVNFFELSGNGQIRKALASDGAKVYNGYRFRYKPEEETSWPTCDSTYTEGKPKKLIVKYLGTGKEVECKSIKEASRLLKLSGDAIRRLARRSLPGDIYSIQFVDQN